MRCHDVAAALVDASQLRSPEVESHLSGCEDCRALAALHASASSLRLPSPPALAPVPREAVLHEVRRRAFRRRASAGAVASLGLAALVLWLQPATQGRPVDLSYEEGSAPRPELGLSRAAPAALDDDTARVVLAGRGNLLNLMGEVRGFTRRDLVVEDESYRPFGTLPAWVRPPDSRALEAPPFRTVVMTLYPQE
ncbi:hypothetical protein HPC49_08080 [Pyxidicoccus fallax]|uniref:Zinc-finger domain-containing protein n=1 Tax=Pyxidicoccus fallax TaxID=394095 RepID=A0A848LJB7_9BACT|nr:hypothetical protein [Pyxidicoccus fallax]NMO17766.1 hypothetical protein [Pyxidicoccus fallax]NPC78211.1 hypothetical protein [Pyxidicoccus fallax]